MKTIYPNDKCPCGSGKKYKACHGSKNQKIENTTDKYLVDFVIDNLYRDVLFLQTALELLSDTGYNYCKNNSGNLQERMKNDKLISFVKNDEYGLFARDYPVEKVKEVVPYGGTRPEVQEDIISLEKKGHMRKEQVILFHRYLMENLSRRFDDYHYVPSKDIAQKQFLGALTYRGYDFLIALTMYLELQLGVHVFFENHEFLIFENSEDEIKKHMNALFPEYTEEDYKKYKLREVFAFCVDYMNEISVKNYNQIDEINLYNKKGAYEKSGIFEKLKKF